MSGTTSRDPQHRADDDDDLPQGLKILSRCAEYLVKLVESPRSVPCAPGISLDMKGQLETVASTIRSAWSNRVCLEWTVKDLARELYPPSGDTGTGKVHRTRFRGPVTVTDYGLFPIIDRPTVYIDRDGVVIAWYLPGLFGRALNGKVYTAAYRAGHGSAGNAGSSTTVRSKRVEVLRMPTLMCNFYANTDPHVISHS